MLLIASRGAQAQPAPVMQGDVAGTLGFFSVDTGGREPVPSDNWAHSLFGAASAGWYWTDHLKSEAEFGAGTRATTYGYQSVTGDGYSGFASTRSTRTRRALSVSQQYQFFRNASFHPYVAGGATLTWQRTSDHVNAALVYDNKAPYGRVVAPERNEGPRSEVIVRPFVGTGFKAYITKRAFFRSDLRVSLRGGADDVLVRFGFGADF
jgi:hypothetical protein